MLFFPFLLLLFHVLHVQGLEVSNNSACADICGGGSTFSSDLVCADTDYDNTSQGKAMRQCLQCEGNSTAYEGPWDNDIYWFLFNMKYTAQECLFGGNSSPQLTACNATCTPLKKTLLTLWLLPPRPPLYDYCSVDNGAFIHYGGGCANCLENTLGSVILGNFLSTMLSACGNQPNASKSETISIPRKLFMTATLGNVPTSSSSASSALASTSASTTSTSSPTTSSSPSSSPSSGLSTGAKAGIGAGIGAGAVVALAAIGVFFFVVRPRRRRQAEGGEYAIAPQTGSPPTGPYEIEAKEGSPGKLGEHNSAVELQSRAVHEADGTTQMAELPADNH
ncbi:hypothetical protein L228DRAFT_248847 [Xylona heveae TC161]|uniref:WSC domain-containing protein n=1 Tax=Xylona heveae (strain CBS 132557 / TC161) TaxID=1328760 RepID=A0A165FKK1_XYLHT|nr:hypothetical protein L228DRAFT_248847 [Xylona heveae TC161]KZF21084.1 hypothetical protein L228DRAFT_248847 [Xylona heveae TC161]